MNDRIRILGCRGSVPVSGGEYLHFGGATTCFVLEMSGETVIIDGGSGILNIDAQLVSKSKSVTMLLTHPHADHMLGLPMCWQLFQKGVKLTIYGAEFSGESVETQVNRLISPLLWPVSLRQLSPGISFKPLPESLCLGAVKVDTMEGNHPGGVILLRISDGEKSVVCMTDCTLNKNITGKHKELEFARDCDLLLVDGQYSPEQWKTTSEFGHSTWMMAAEFGKMCGAGKTVITHHDPGSTDKVLFAAEKEVQSLYPDCVFAREGEVLSL